MALEKPKHLYYLLVDLGLTEAQRNAIFLESYQEGDGNNGPKPHLRTQYRLSLDGTQAMFEGAFKDVTPGSIIRKLINAGVGPSGSIRNSVKNLDHGQEFTFELRQDINTWIPILKYIVFGGVSANYGASFFHARNWIIAHTLEWEVTPE